MTIACSTESNPEPILSLLKERRVLATAVYERQLALDLPSVTHEDDGEYWCVAENQYGQQATAFNLTVECESPVPTHLGCGGENSGSLWVSSAAIPPQNQPHGGTEQVFLPDCYK